MQLVRSLPALGTDARAVLNGLVGDELAAQGSALAIPLTFHGASGAELPLDPEGLRAALPDAGGRICVFVHGLMSSDSIWRSGQHASFGESLAEARGITPVYVRYNTGRHISTNGRDLAARLQALVRAWPCRVDEVNLVGHSMGGLVIRSACHYGRHAATLTDRLRRRGPWPAKVRRVVLLGVPNGGAALEVLANLTSAALWSLPTPVTRLIGLGLDRRSEGIKDLRWGSVLDEDWVERDPGVTARPDRHPVHAPRHADHLLIAGSLAGQPDADRPPLVNRIFGDALVTASSAHGVVGAEEPALFRTVTVRLCPKVNHLALPNRPEVYDEIVSWWDRPSGRAPRGRNV